jgi:long-chain acyl-CoA synthetase
MIITKQLLYATRTFPQKLAVIDGPHRYSYKQLAERTVKLKRSLQKLGVNKGDRVGFLMHNDFRIMELMYGVTALGAVVVPLNTRFSVEENAFVLNDAGIKVLYIHRDFLPILPKLEKHVSTLCHVILAEDKDIVDSYREINVLSYENLLVEQPVEGLTYDGVQEDDIAGLFYTGGTTGRSKGVMLTHKNLVINSHHVALNVEYNKNDIYLHAAPMFHLADHTSTFAITLTGGTHAVVRRFNSQKVLQVIEEVGVTAALFVPTMINMILHDGDFHHYDTTSLRFVLYGASPMSVDLLKKARSLMPAAQFIQVYGMTEAAPLLTVLKPKDHVINGTWKEEKRLSSCGQAVQGVEIKVVDPEGSEMPTREVGEFIARGPNIMKGYWKLPDETAKAIRNGWYYTGDMGYKDEEDYFYIVDRAKDMIISGGENVYSVELEQVLCAHPAVHECAVFGIPDEKWGESIKAAVVLKQNNSVTEDEILSFVRQKLANYKVPKSIDFLPELPKSGAGKILKRKLRDQYWDQDARKEH